MLSFDPGTSSPSSPTLPSPPPPPQIDKELVLLSVLKEPVSRSIFDYALRSKDIASLFRHLLLRQKKRAGSIPECPTPEDPAIAQLLKKLLSQVRTALLRRVIDQCRAECFVRLASDPTAGSRVVFSSFQKAKSQTSVDSCLKIVFV